MYEIWYIYECIYYASDPKRHSVALCGRGIYWPSSPQVRSAAAEPRRPTPAFRKRRLAGSRHYASRRPLPGPPCRWVATIRAACQARAFRPARSRSTLRDAIQKGLAANLGPIGAGNASRAAHAERIQALSALLPNIAANASDTVTQVNLAAYGFQFKPPANSDFSIPTVVGPFNYSSLQGTLSQSVYDPVALRNWKARKEERAQLRCFRRRMRANWLCSRWVVRISRPSRPPRDSIRSALRWRMPRLSTSKRKCAKRRAQMLASM